jgi:uncharacterized membrane protein
MSEVKKSSKKSLFTRLSSLHKILISLVIAIAVYLLIQIKHLDILTHVMIGWDTLSLFMILFSWITFSVTTSQQIRELAKAQDSSRIIIFIIVLISTFASFLAVLLLIVAKKDFQTAETETFHLTIAIAGMILSWVLIHTIFTLRYAHIFYDNDEERPERHAAGLEFPGEKKPDYLDFAYFSFVLGMTFQVSDVQVTSKRLRRLALLHGILSFGYNTIMIALTINLIAGFGN